MHKDIYRWIEELKRYNPLLNLVSESMVIGIEEHIENTMELLVHIQEPAIADLGSGSGLPAIPYKIMYPESSVVMIERAEKKCVFLRHMLDVLNLENFELIEADPLVSETGPFAALMSRAFSPRKTLERIVLKTGGPAARFYYLSTGREHPIKHRAFSLIGHEERRCRNYTLSLDTYQITSRQ
jgi:16S rRNA (guanine527-N7)-methyltransferase